MIAVDTNILIYAFRSDYEQHDAARAALRELLAGEVRCAIPWPCVHEFLGIVSNPRVHCEPDTIETGLKFIGGVAAAPRVEFIGEGHDHFALLSRLLKAGRIRGAMVHDARVAAICLAHGVVELWSADRDFLRFPQLHVRNPLVHV